jgi:hypothetical protein
MPRVDSFEFGSIVIDDRRYGHDVLIFPDGTIKRRKGGFWKFGSHIIKKVEIDELLQTNPEIVVLGTGTDARVRLASAAELALKGQGIDCVVLPSLAASERLNDLLNSGKRVAALIHVTC